jgi:16S rRNA processing protein RimM
VTVAQDRVCLAVVTAPHGVKGLVRVKSFTAEPEALARYAPIENERGERVALSLIGAAKGVLLARIEGVGDRDAAERVKGMRLYLPRAALPAPEEEEYYHADLLGLAVELADGTALGHVRAVHEYGAGDSIEIERPSGAPVLVPFTRAAVPIVDLAGGRIVVAPPEGVLAPVAGAADEEQA